MDIEVEDLTTSWKNRTGDRRFPLFAAATNLPLFDASRLSLWTSNILTKQPEIRESHRRRDRSASNETFT
jgi:hypothetical protein